MKFKIVEKGEPLSNINVEIWDVLFSMDSNRSKIRDLTVLLPQAMKPLTKVKDFF